MSQLRHRRVYPVAAAHNAHHDEHTGQHGVLYGAPAGDFALRLEVKVKEARQDETDR